MEIKPRVYKTCKTCAHQTLVENEKYGCDECRKPIDIIGGAERMYLDVSIHHHTKAASHMQFCSWECALKALKKVKSDYFVSMPFLHYDHPQKGIRAKDFFAAIKAFK